MKYALAVVLPLALAGALSAQLPKDAEERHQMKYGRPSPVAESQQRTPSRQAPAKDADAFRKLDADGDGKISREEWAARDEDAGTCGRSCCRNSGA